MSGNRKLRGEGITLIKNPPTLAFASRTDIYRSSRITPGSLRTYTFHGATRASSPESIAGYDIVLTTYGVLCADFKAKRVLQNVEWFRIVLDEGTWHFNNAWIPRRT